MLLAKGFLGLTYFNTKQQEMLAVSLVCFVRHVQPLICLLMADHELSMKQKEICRWEIYLQHSLPMQSKRSSSQRRTEKCEHPLQRRCDPKVLEHTYTYLFIQYFISQ